MVEIAVYHHDSLQRKKVLQDFINSLKQSRVYGKVYSIQNLQKFSENLLNGKYQFDIICIDTAEKEYAQMLMEHTPSNPEYILLDTPAEEVSGYMRYKPAAWIHSDGGGQREVAKALQSCLYHLHRKREECFCIRTKAKSVRIPYRQILYLESRLHQVIVHTVRPQDVCAFAAVLDDVERALPEETFFRCHQSFLVNIDSIYQLDRTGRNLILSNGETLGISKRYYKDVNRIFPWEATI